MKQLFSRIPVSKAFRDIFFRHTRFVYGLIFLWFVSMALGFVISDAVGYELLAAFREKVSGLENESVLSTFLFIVWNNLKATFFTLIFGIFVVVPIGILVFNGVLVGVFLKQAEALAAIPLSSLLFALVPHGILEIPAIIFSVILGTLFGLKLYGGKHVASELSRKEFVRDVLIVYTTVIIPMIFVAALIESTVSAYIAGLLI